MNPPTPSVPTIDPSLPATNTGETEVVIEVDNLQESPSSVDAVISFGSAGQAIELVGKTQGADLGSGSATLTHAISFADGVMSFGITKNHADFSIDRVIIVAGGQTFTFE